MKNTILSTLIFVFLFTACKKDETTQQPNCKFTDFKYYKGTKDDLGELQNNYILLGIDTTYSSSQIDSLISTLSQIDHNYKYIIHATSQYKFKEIPLRLKSPKNCEEITRIITDFQQNNMISYVHYTMQTNDCMNLLGENIGNLCINSYGSNFYVKVFNENDLTDLNRMINETKTELVKQDEFMPKWFELRATKNSTGDALKMANYFYETGFFESSEPGISKYSVE